MKENEYVTLQERLDAMEYETGSRMDMLDNAVRKAGGFDQPSESTFTDKLKKAGNWIANHKEEVLVASVSVITGAVIYALYKSQKQETPPAVVGKIIPVKQFHSKGDQGHSWALAMYKYDGDGNEVSRLDVADQLINGDYTQLDDDLIIFQEGDDNEKR